jgi:DNA-binding NarL/FixJ family response regulator
VSGPLSLCVAAGPALYRELLCRALAAEPGFRVVGGAGDESAALELVEKSRPQILLFDYEALGPNGESAIARFRRGAPTTRVLVLATRSGPETVERVLRAGAAGLVGKESDFATIVRALRSVGAGEIWANRRVTALALERLTDFSAHRGGAVGVTEREAEIVDLVTQGLRNKEIAHRLGIHEKTVKTHLNNIFRKLHVESRIALALRGAS